MSTITYEGPVERDVEVSAYRDECHITAEFDLDNWAECIADNQEYDDPEIIIELIKRTIDHHRPNYNSNGHERREYVTAITQALADL